MEYYDIEYSYYDYVVYPFDGGNLSWNSSLNYTDYYYDYNNIPHFAEFYVLPTVFIIICIHGILGNGLVVYVVCRNGPMKTVTNMYLVNLALADLLFLVISVPFTASIYILKTWSHGQSICKMVNYLMVVTTAVGVCTLSVLSVDRHNAIVHPISSRAYRTIRRTAVKLVVIWLCPMLCLCPIAVVSRITEYWDYGTIKRFCVEHWSHQMHHSIYIILMFVMLYGIPLTLITICYFKIVRALWSNLGPGRRARRMMSLNIRARRKVVKMVLVVTIVFALFCMPLHIVHLHSDFGNSQYSVFFYNFKMVAHCLSYANSAVNPVIYCFMSENFRCYLRLAFSCRRRTTAPISTLSKQEAPHCSNADMFLRSDLRAAGMRHTTAVVHDVMVLEAL